MEEDVGREVEQAIELIAQARAGERRFRRRYAGADDERRGHHLELL